MRVAIAGAGNVGQFIAADLLAAGHQVTMIEKDLHVLEVARPALKEAEWFPFDACEVLSLVMAGIAHADVMVAATGDDEDNLVISLLAKQEFAVPRVVARVNNPKNHGLFNEAWGVDVAVSTPHILRSLVEEAVTVGSMIKVMQFERGPRVAARRDPGRPVGGGRADPARPGPAGGRGRGRGGQGGPRGRAQGGHRVRRRRRGPGGHLRGQREPGPRAPGRRAARTRAGGAEDEPRTSRSRRNGYSRS